MEIYYRRITTYQSYPNKDLIETDEVHFSKSKRKFDKNVFLKINPSITVDNRIIEIKKALKCSTVKLVKV